MLPASVSLFWDHHKACACPLAGVPMDLCGFAHFSFFLSNFDGPIFKFIDYFFCLVFFLLPYGISHFSSRISFWFLFIISYLYVNKSINIVFFCSCLPLALFKQLWDRVVFKSLSSQSAALFKWPILSGFLIGLVTFCWKWHLNLLM